MEEILLPLTGGSNKPYTMWDDYVPQKTTGRHTDVYLLDSIEAPSEYGKLYETLIKADKGDTISLHLNNGGGYVDTGFMIADAIKNTKATVTGILQGTVASITTIIALLCHKVNVGSHVQWLSHNYSGGVQGKGGEMKAQMEFMSRELAASFREIHTGFFTPKEMDHIINDGDIWLNGTEVRARLDARKSGNPKALEAVAQERLDRLSK